MQRRWLLIVLCCLIAAGLLLPTGSMVDADDAPDVAPRVINTYTRTGIEDEYRALHTAYVGCLSDAELAAAVDDVARRLAAVSLQIKLKEVESLLRSGNEAHNAAGLMLLNQINKSTEGKRITIDNK